MGRLSPRQCVSPTLQDDISPAVTQEQQATGNIRRGQQRTTPVLSRGCRCMPGQGTHQQRGLSLDSQQMMPIPENNNTQVQFTTAAHLCNIRVVSSSSSSSSFTTVIWSRCNCCEQRITMLSSSEDAVAVLAMTMQLVTHQYATATALHAHSVTCQGHS